MNHVASELRMEVARQALDNWSDDAFELLKPGVCDSCCLLSSGGNGTAD